jgi:hypothetical protein
MNELTPKEKRVLWCVLNQAQDIGLRSIADLTNKLNGKECKILDDWFNQTVDEYDTINMLKYKLCGDEE